MLHALLYFERYKTHPGSLATSVRSGKGEESFSMRYALICSSNRFLPYRKILMLLDLVSLIRKLAVTFTNGEIVIDAQ